MKYFYFSLFIFHFSLFTACRPAAAPVSVSNRPISINNIPQTNLPLPPSKNIENLGWTLFDGRVQTLGEYKGKVVVLDFWATFCPPCLEEIPHLVELQNKYADLMVIGLHVGGEEDVPKVPAFVKKLKINYVLAYPEDELNKILLGNDNAIPQTFVFDRDGRLIEKFVGYDQKVKTDLDKAITQALD